MLDKQPEDRKTCFLRQRCECLDRSTRPGSGIGFSGMLRFHDFNNMEIMRWLSSAADVERIEVISGPGRTLWGANAMNGVINVITATPRAD
jgi:outer membrane receptor protein involved in Fe transport